jgi:cell division septation protein DedD
MGEWDRARTALEPLLGKSVRARFLYISIETITKGNTSALAVIVDNPEYSQMKSEILFLLWRVTRDINRDTTTADRWRQRLIDEFPDSPEARLAGSVASSASESVAILPSPFWLFLGGFDSLSVMEAITEGRPPRPSTPAATTQATARVAASTTATTQTSASSTAVAQASGSTVTTQASAPTPQASAPSTATQATVSISTVKLQTGVYSRHPNAQAQAASLQQAGFSPTIEQRGEMWVVTVPAGADTNRSIAALRAAGFESFPLR